jgi:hypothetical protein
MEPCVLERDLEMEEATEEAVTEVPVISSIN